VCLAAITFGEQTQDGTRSLDALHSIPVHKLRAQAAATEALTVPESYPHFTPFVENKKQVRDSSAVPQFNHIGACIAMWPILTMCCNGSMGVTVHHLQQGCAASIH
jgi:hypothetical protein